MCDPRRKGIRYKTAYTEPACFSIYLLPPLILQIYFGGMAHSVMTIPTYISQQSKKEFKCEYSYLGENLRSLKHSDFAGRSI